MSDLHSELTHSIRTENKQQTPKIQTRSILKESTSLLERRKKKKKPGGELGKPEISGEDGEKSFSDRDTYKSERDVISIKRVKSGSSPDLTKGEKGTIKKLKINKLDTPKINVSLNPNYNTSSIKEPKPLSKQKPTDKNTNKNSGNTEQKSRSPGRPPGGSTAGGASFGCTAADRSGPEYHLKDKEQELPYMSKNESESRRDTPRSSSQKGDPQTFQSKYVETTEHKTDTESDTEFMDTSIITPQPTPSDSEKFISPRKTTNIGKLLRIRTPPTTTQNTYQPLADITEKEQTAAAEITQKAQSSKNINPGPPKPVTCPPIVLRGTPDNHKIFITELNRHIKKGYQIKYGRQTTIIYIKDKQEHIDYKNKLKQENDTEFHTYTSRDEKTHAFVLRGIQGDVEIQDIKYELRDEYQIQIKNIYKMKTKSAPLYLIITDDKTTLKHLNANVKSISNIRVTWERRMNQRLITQCRRCQGWGHATSNCYRKPRCLKCAAEHWTKDCTKTIDEPPKCANCSGAHPASSIECPIYIKRTMNITNQENRAEPPRYVPAPPPTTNIWAQRAAGAATARTMPQPEQQQSNTTNRQTEPYLRQPVDNQRRNTELGGIDGFADFAAASERLSSLVNMREAARALQALCDILANVQGQFQIMMALHNYVENVLPQYRVQRST